MIQIMYVSADGLCGLQFDITVLFWTVFEWDLK